MTAGRLCLLSVLVAGWTASATVPEDPGSSSIPVIDISPLLLRPTNQPAATNEASYAAADVIRQIGHACETIGFFAITNHGVDSSIIDDAWGAATRFFDLSEEEKGAVGDEGADYPYGYERGEDLAAGKRARADSVDEGDSDGSSAAECSASGADQKETFSLGPPDPSTSGMPSRRFPPNPPDLSGALTAYYSAMENLALVLLRAFARALELEEGWFGGYMSGHASALRLVNYPAILPSLDAAANGEEVSETVRIRAGAHTDYGAFTILRSGGPGLQVARDAPAAGEGRNGSGGGEEGSQDEIRWVDAPKLPDGFIINLGDLMQRWTNDRWRSTLHRVIIPPNQNLSYDGRTGASAGAERRQSMAYFVNVRNDAIVTPLETCVGSGDGDDEGRTSKPKYQPIRAGEYLMRKHLASTGVRPFEEEEKG